MSRTKRVNQTTHKAHRFLHDAIMTHFNGGLDGGLGFNPSIPQQ